MLGVMIKGVMFDFSGTLFRIESTARWLNGVLERTGTVLPGADAEECAARLEGLGALPGGPPPREVPPALARLWRERDLDAGRHRAAYTALTRLAPPPAPALADVLYDRHREPDAWRPYPDTLPVLRGLGERGVPVAVVSNIGWDLRPVFRHHGADPFVDAYVLSFEHGTQKPSPSIFRHACDMLGLDPADVLMVGDDPVADAGAAELGCPVHLVDHLPADRRPDALLPVLGLVG